MRKEFVNLLHSEMSKNEDIILLTGDLGYGLFDRIRIDYPDRFYNVLSAEQLMMGAAVGMAMDNKIPIVYSITPFVIYRPFELIRNYLDHENIPVKIVGGGRNKEYGYLGFSHWAEEDVDILSNFKNLDIFKPAFFSKDVFDSFLYNQKPSYLNLSK